MAKKPSVTTVASGYYGRQALNDNFEALRDAFDNTLSRDGSTPNAMGADLDMNSNDILNAQTVNAESLRLDGVLVSSSSLSATGATLYSDNYTGDGSTVAYTMSYQPFIKDNTQVYIDGVYQNKVGYSISGTTLTFSEAPPLNSDIEIVVARSLNVAATDASNVGYNQGGTGAVSTTVEAKLQETVSVKDFGAVGDGVTDDTAALKAFFDECILTGKSGHINAGTYMIQLGQLAFDNGFTDTIWPNITTDGYFSTKFKAISNIDAPFISITNGTATGPVDNVWRGGELGGIRFIPASGSTVGLTSMHGLWLQGLSGCNFGYMRADGLGGSTIHINRALFGGNNPDPYNVTSCKFEAVEGNRNQGAAFYNDNFVGFTACTIGYLRAIENVNGAFFGMGAGNRIDVISAGSCGGWAVGDQSVVTGGASTRFFLGLAEFDDMEYGIDTSICSNSDFGIVRFVHRYNFGPLNPSGGYWPRLALKIGNPARTVTGMRFYVIDRIEAGGTKPDLGVFADFTNAGGNLSDTHIDRQILDNASFGISNSDLFANFNLNSAVRYRNIRTPIIDTIEFHGGYVRARNSGAVAIPSGGFTGSSNWVAYDTQVEGNSTLFDNSTYEYTVPANGTYRISAALNLTLSAGTRVRMAIYADSSAIFSRYAYAVTANAECYTVQGTSYLTAGTIIKVNADQNSGSGVTTGGTLSVNDNYLIIERI